MFDVVDDCGTVVQRLQMGEWEWEWAARGLQPIRDFSLADRADLQSIQPRLLSLCDHAASLQLPTENHQRERDMIGRAIDTQYGRCCVPNRFETILCTVMSTQRTRTEAPEASP